MRQIKRFVRWLGIFLAVVGLARSVEAASVPVDNAGFDRVPLASGGYTYTIANWVGGVDPSGTPRSPWISNGYYGNQPAPVTEALVSQTANVYQPLGATFQSGITYTFSIDVGVADPGSENWRIYFYDATAGTYEAPLATANGTVPADGAMRSVNVQYTATPTEAGHAMGIGVAGIEGGYYCYYDNAAVQSSSGATAPVINQHPEDQTILAGDPNAVAVFTVSAGGTPPLNYLWRFNGAPVSGGTNASLTISNAGPADLGDYDVVVANAHGSVTSQTAALSQVTPDYVVPYLQSPSPSSIRVSWKTDAGTESTVYYGTASNALNQTASGSVQVLDSSYFYHDVRLTDLSPDTYYYYRVQTGAEGSAVHRFRTQPPLGTSTGHYRVLVMGDHQVRSQQRYATLVGRARSKLESKYGTPIEESVNLVLNVGDQVDVGTLDHYEHLHFSQSAAISANLPIMTTVGNHETYSDPGLANYKAHFFYDDLGYDGIASPGGEHYYSYQQANIVFVHLSSEHVEAPQTSWVSDLATAADTDADVDWMISLVHRPYQAEQYVGDISGYTRETLMPIFARTTKHVMNIGGHHHLYHRGQMRDWPMYNVISGGTAWDQYWGQSTEIDFDDVQKTVANWTWQLIDFNLDDREMVVECYSEAHPLLGFVYTNKLVDTFHRRLGEPAPDKPSITNTVSGEVALPYTVGTTPFSTTSSEVLNSTQFQVSPVPDFSFNVVDLIRDVENQYGDTGSPDYLPVDIHAGVDILTYTLQSGSVANGTWYVRARHRDANTLWSPWADPIQITVGGGAEPDLVRNAGFDSVNHSPPLADFWTANGGSVRGGADGGFGWDAGYYTGGYPTDGTFATTFDGPVRQDLFGADGTYRTGWTYELSVCLFSSDRYASSVDAYINWRIALAANGTVVAEDVWFSDEFADAGETVPPGREIPIEMNQGPGLTTGTVVYVATSADDGKTIGIALGGDMTLGSTTGDDYYGHMDNVILTIIPPPPAELDIALETGQIRVLWDGFGDLEQVATSPEEDGQWHLVPGASSPYAVPNSPTSHSYRIVR